MTDDYDLCAEVCNLRSCVELECAMRAMARPKCAVPMWEVGLRPRHFESHDLGLMFEVGYAASDLRGVDARHTAIIARRLLRRRKLWEDHPSEKPGSAKPWDANRLISQMEPYLVDDYESMHYARDCASQLIRLVCMEAAARQLYSDAREILLGRKNPLTVLPKDFLKTL